MEQIIVGYDHIIEDLDYAVGRSLPVMLVGETGIGKTSLIRYLAQQRKQEYRRLNLNGQTTIDEFVGKMLINQKGTYWQDGVLTDAMRKGHWIILDEINAALPEILFVLHSLLDDDQYIVLSENDGEIVRPHKNFRLFASMNPSGRYSGTKELNKAFLSRFPMILQIDFPLAETESKIVSAYAKRLSPGMIETLVKMANELRESYKKEEIEYVVSTRDLINAALIAEDKGIHKALTLSILSRCTKEDIRAVQTACDLHFGKMGTKIAGTLSQQEKLEHLGSQLNELLGDIEKVNDIGLIASNANLLLRRLPTDGMLLDTMKGLANLSDQMRRIARQASDIRIFYEAFNET